MPAQQHLQYVRRVARIRLLFAHHRRPDLRRVPDPQLMSQFVQHALEPERVSGSFDAYSHPPRQRRIERSGFATLVL
jgi:hypothetical protein